MEFVTTPVVFGCAFLFVLGVGMLLQPRPAERRLARLASKGPVASAPQRSLVRGTERGLLGVFSRIGALKGRSDVSQLRARFVHAGFRSPSAPAIYYGIRISLALGLPLVVGLLSVAWGLPAIQEVALLLSATAVGYLAPSFYIDRRVTRRKAAISRALPDALDLMVVCVEAGLGINQSLARVAEEFAVKRPILAREFSLVVHETRAGMTTTDALRGLSDRTGVSDVSSLVALLVQTERFGTSVANALRVHADAMRVRRMQRAEERAQMATLKLILPSTLIFAALLMVFLAPGMYNLFTALSGIE